MSEVKLTVHRATNEIGGNCIELATAEGRILLDVGRPLDAPDDASGLLPKSLDLGAPVDGVLISHPHQDHYGLLEETPRSWPVYCGEAAAKLIRLTADVTRRLIDRSFSQWEHGRTIQVGPFSVTPLLTDHSAFDAYMLLIEAHGKRLLYSGDFRAHGRKSALVERMKADPPGDLDVLLLEGTNLGADKPVMSETDLEERFADLFRQTRGRVFVAWSAQNVDRTVTLYRAALRTGRTLVVDLYTAEVLEALAEHGRLPRPGWKNLKVVITRAFARLYRAKGREDFVARMAAHGISAAGLASEPGRWVTMIRPSLMRDFEAKGVAPGPDDAWSWSMWRGYLDNKGGARLEAWFEAGGSRPEHIHTSGHASPAELRAFALAMNPKRLVPIHGLAWDSALGEFANVERLADGEPLLV